MKYSNKIEEKIQFFNDFMMQGMSNPIDKCFIDSDNDEIIFIYSGQYNSIFKNIVKIHLEKSFSERVQFYKKIAELIAYAHERGYVLKGVDLFNLILPNDNFEMVRMLFLINLSKNGSKRKPLDIFSPPELFISLKA